jgi:hypothetical protein
MTVPPNTDVGITHAKEEKEKSFTSLVLDSKEHIERDEIIFSLLADINVDTLPEKDRSLFLERRQALAYQLFIAYRDGKNSLAADELKADYYLASILFVTPQQTLIDNVLFWFTWLTTARLGLVRFSREYSLLINGAGILTDNFAVLSLSYIVEFFACVCKLIDQSFRPETSEDGKYNVLHRLWRRFEWRRFKQAFWSREFLSALTNAAVWAVVNVICYCYFPLTPVCFTVAILNLLGFGFDIWHDKKFAEQELQEYKKIQDDNETQKLLGEYYLLGNSELIANKNSLLTKKISGANEKLGRLYLIALGIFVGMLVLYLPVLVPALISVAPAAKFLSGLLVISLGKWEITRIIGSTAVMCFGFIYGGLLGRLYRVFKPNDKSFTESVVSGFKKFTKSVAEFLKNNVEEVTLSSTVVVLGQFTTVPLISAGIISVGVPAVAVATFLAVKGIFSVVKNLWEPLEVPPPRLTTKECSSLTSILVRLQPQSENTVSLTSQELIVIQKASQLSESEWLRHTRNWSLKDQTKKEAILYSSFDDLFNMLQQKYKEKPEVTSSDEGEFKLTINTRLDNSLSSLGDSPRDDSSSPSSNSTPPSEDESKEVSFSDGSRSNNKRQYPLPRLINYRRKDVTVVNKNQDNNSPLTQLGIFRLKTGKIVTISPLPPSSTPTP